MDGGRISEGFPLDKGSHALKNLVRQQKAVINPPNSQTWEDWQDEIICQV